MDPQGRAALAVSRTLEVEKDQFSRDISSCLAVRLEQTYDSTWQMQLPHNDRSQCLNKSSFYDVMEQASDQSDANFCFLQRI